jgi:hypothetical protein
VIAAVVIACAVPDLVLASRDVVIFDNGDRLTGEVKSLERGKLRFKTDATGTIAIEWDDVAFLTSDQNLQTETEDGVRYLGHLLETREARQLLVQTDSGPVPLELGSVTLMAPIEERGLDRLDGEVSAGINFAKAEQISTSNVSVDLNYRTESRVITIDFDALVTDSGDDEQKPSQSSGLDLSYNRLLPERWVAGGTMNFERNEEQGLDLRSSVGAGVGRYLRQTNSSILLLSGGLLLTREQRAEADNVLPAADAITDDFLEASVKLRWDWFRYDAPELDLTTTLHIIPNLSESGEYRGEFEIKLKWEIVEDLFWSLSLKDTYDSKVLEFEGDKNDYSLITSVGWEF